MKTYIVYAQDNPLTPFHPPSRTNILICIKNVDHNTLSEDVIDFYIQMMNAAPDKCPLLILSHKYKKISYDILKLMKKTRLLQNIKVSFGQFHLQKIIDAWIIFSQKSIKTVISEVSEEPELIS